MVEGTHLTSVLKTCLVIGIVAILIFLAVLETRTTVGVGNIGLPSEAVENLKKLLGH